MEQSIRTQPPGPRRRTPPRGVEAAVPGQAAPPDARPRPQPKPGRARPARLTAVGTGVLAVAGTVSAAAADRALFGGLGVLFGLGYLVVCFQVAVRVRSTDLPAAPISGPIAFAVALLLLGPVTGHGVTAQVVALATGLALRAVWLFAGTGLATVIVLARFVALRRTRRR